MSADAKERCADRCRRNEKIFVRPCSRRVTTGVCLPAATLGVNKCSADEPRRRVSASEGAKRYFSLLSSGRSQRTSTAGLSGNVCRPRSKDTDRNNQIGDRWTKFIIGKFFSFMACREQMPLGRTLQDAQTLGARKVASTVIGTTLGTHIQP